MKRAFCLLLAIALLLGLAGCGGGRAVTRGASIRLGDSERFSQAEQRKAADCVLREFRKWETPCTMKLVYYDEASYDAEETAIYASSLSKGMFEPKDVILLYSNFHTPEGAQSGGFNPNADYTDWKWVLVRDHARAPWRVVANGYA